MRMKPITIAATLILACAAAIMAYAPYADAGLLASPGDADVPEQAPAAAPIPSDRELATMSTRFAPADIGADISALPDRERRALAKLVDAAKLMDSLFMRQAWAGNEAMLEDLSRKAIARSRAPRSAGDADSFSAPFTRLHYFLINKGPWSRLDHNRVFIPGAPAKPDGANFYPAGATKEEVQRWIDSLTGEAKTRATGFFTTIRRTPAGFTAVPYSVEYQGELALAAALLREAAELTAQPTLKKFLTTRADGFLTDDYYASDVAWMEFDASIEPTIGPYEVYEDEWFNFKAAFEAFITVRDEAESNKLQSFSAHLQSLESALPIDPKYRNPALGALAPIRVVNIVFAAGDGNRGVQTAAFNLPNDERVVKEKGTKRVMLKNMQDAKFRQVLVPISKVALLGRGPAERLVRRVLHPHPDARADARPRAAQHHGRRPRHNGTAGAEGHLQCHRRSQSGRLRPLGAETACRSEARRRRHRADDVHDVSRVCLPFDPLRDQRGARPRHRGADELLPGCRRLHRPA